MPECWGERRSTLIEGQGVPEVLNEDRGVLLEVEKGDPVVNEVGDWPWQYGLDRVEYPDKSNFG